MMIKRERKRGNKLIFFSLLSSLLFCNYSYAQSNKPTTFKNGIQGESNIIDSSGNNLGNLSSLISTANNAIPKSQIGVANGVAGLDNNSLMANKLKGVTFVDTFGNDRRLDTPTSPDSDFSDETSKDRILAFRKNQVLTPYDFGVTFDGTVADATRLQNYIDTVQPTAIKAKGLWPVNSKFNNPYEPYGRWTPNHSKASSIFFDLTQGMMQSDKTNIPITAPGVVSPQAGTTGAADSAGDLYESFINGALTFSKQHNGGWSSAAQLIDEEYYMNTDDHPNYFQPSGEYNNTIIHDIEGHDDGRTGQIVALQLGIENSHTKGFQTQEQLLNFNGSYTGKSGHWDIVGGQTDKTQEPSTGGWEHTMWEADGAGTGPDAVTCEYRGNAACGRQGIVMTPSMYVNNNPYSFTTQYVAMYDSNGNVNSNSPRHKYYNPDQSSHITFDNLRSYIDQFGENISVSGIFRAIPSEKLYGEMKSTEYTTNNITGLYVIDYIETSCGYWCNAGTGYKVGDIITPTDKRIPVLTVTSVDSNGGATGYTYLQSSAPFPASSANVINYTTDKGLQLIIHTRGIAFSVDSANLNANGSGYKIGDTLSVSNLGVSATVSDVDQTGSIKTINFTSDHRQFASDPSGSVNTNGGTGTGATLNITSTYGYIITKISMTPVFSWHQSGNGYKVGDTGTITLTDSHGGIHKLADIVVDSIYGTSTGGINTWHVVKYYTLTDPTIANATGVPLIATSGSGTNAQFDITAQSNNDMWFKAHTFTGSKYNIQDTVSITAPDGTILANGVVVRTSPSGGIDGNSLVLNQIKTGITKDYSGEVSVNGTASGDGNGKLFVEMIPDQTRREWFASTNYSVGTEIVRYDTTGKHTVYEVTTAGTSSNVEPTWTPTGNITDGTVVWTPVTTGITYHIDIVHTGIPFPSIYNVDGTICISCTMWEWVSEDEFEWGNALQVQYTKHSYYSTMFSADGRFTNALIDYSASVLTKSDAAVIRLPKESIAFDFTSDSTELGKNKNTMGFLSQNDLNGNAIPGLQISTTLQGSSQKETATIFDENFSTNFPGVFSIGSGNDVNYENMNSGKTNLPVRGFTFINGRSGANNYDMYAANSAFTFFQGNTKTTTDGATSTDQTSQVFKFDILSGSEIDTDLTTKGFVYSSQNTVEASTSGTHAGKATVVEITADADGEKVIPYGSIVTNGAKQIFVNTSTHMVEIDSPTRWWHFRKQIGGYTDWIYLAPGSSIEITPSLNNIFNVTTLPSTSGFDLAALVSSDIALEPDVPVGRMVYDTTQDQLLVNTKSQGWVHPAAIPSTFASLPTAGAYTGEPYFCTDCYSKLREDGDTQTGVIVYWNGSRWNDSIGIAIMH